MTAVRVCANCRVLVQRASATPGEDPPSAWEHVPAFAGKFSRSVCVDPAPGREPSGSEARFGLARVKTPGGDKQVIRDEVAELVQPAGSPVTVAVDGSYKLTIDTRQRVIKPMSWSYVTTDGRYGLGTSIVPGSVVGGRVLPDGSDPQRSLQAELRAIAKALHALDDATPVTIVSDSQDAIGYMNLWRDGHDVYPGGYNTERAGGRESTLSRLARRALEDRELIRMEWVPGHSGHPLNEAADALAKMARAWTSGRLDKETVAADARTAVLAGLTRYAAAV